MNASPSAPIQEILLFHHSHLDVGYTHSQPILWELQHEFIYQALDWLEETADLPDGARPKWTCEASEPVRRWLTKAAAADVARFVRLHRQGRLDVAALRWHTTPLANRAGLERLLTGKRELEELLGTELQVACQHDVTGVPWPLADVLLDAGVDFFVMAINIHLGRAVQPRPGMLLWEAPSGRTLRVFNGNHYTMFDQLLWAWDDSVERMAQGWLAYQERLQQINYPLDFVYLTTTCSPVMWDNAPPNPFLPDLIRRWNDAGHRPRIRYATFDDLRQRAMLVPDARLPRLRGDWTDYWNFGCAASPVATARNQQAKPLMEAAGLLGGHPGTLAQALEMVDLYDEHTCGYYDSDPAHPQAQTTELLKQALAHQGHEHAAFALMDGLERLAQNPLADKGIARVLLVNPGPLPLTLRPELPAAWFAAREAASERTYRASRMFYDARSWGGGFPGMQARAFGPLELPPFSWRVVELAELPPAEATPDLHHEIEVDTAARRELNFAPAANHQRRTGRLTSPYHILRYDPASGRILSLLDRTQNREVLAPRDGLDFFAFVRERTDALAEDRRHAFYQRDLDQEKVDAMCWQDWSPVHERATRVTHCEVSAGSGSLTLIRELQAPGMLFLTQRITLSAHDPVIHLEVAMELLPEASPQAVYFAFPLDMAAGWQALFDTAGAVVRVDDDQLPGACRNWATTETLAVMWDGAGGVALLTPDAPMVQFGDFHFARPLDVLPRPPCPLLLAWPVNNYWDTNFSRVQAGRIRLRYGWLTFGGPADVTWLRAVAARFRQAPLLWPVTSGGRAAGHGTLQSAPSPPSAT
ncbi:MAG: glycoside hydrolase [Verrucomicrobia bacterium]|nr:glycoside hydrolase [Verrucomicrobiota bacterium]